MTLSTRGHRRLALFGGGAGGGRGRPAPSVSIPRRVCRAFECLDDKVVVGVDASVRRYVHGVLGWGERERRRRRGTSVRETIGGKGAVAWRNPTTATTRHNGSPIVSASIPGAPAVTSARAAARAYGAPLPTASTPSWGSKTSPPPVMVRLCFASAPTRRRSRPQTHQSRPRCPGAALCGRWA